MFPNLPSPGLAFDAGSFAAIIRINSVNHWVVLLIRAPFTLVLDAAMIERSEAIRMVLSLSDGRMAIDKSKIIETETAWVMFPNSPEYIETGDMMKMLVGSGGTLVVKETGQIHEFGSAFGVEENLRIYDLGYFDCDNWDIVITKIKDERECIDVILNLGATYVIPEVESGVEWRVPKNYTRKQVKQMVRNPPIRLNLGRIYFNYELIESLKDQSYFDYKIEPNQGFENCIQQDGPSE